MSPYADALPSRSAEASAGGTASVVIGTVVAVCAAVEGELTPRAALIPDDDLIALRGVLPECADPASTTLAELGLTARDGRIERDTMSAPAARG